MLDQAALLMIQPGWPDQTAFGSTPGTTFEPVTPPAKPERLSGLAAETLPVYLTLSLHRAGPNCNPEMWSP